MRSSVGLVSLVALLHVLACDDGGSDACRDEGKSFDAVVGSEATVGQPYSAELEDVADPEWTSGLYEFGEDLALPEGLTLDTVSLTLSGTPVESGSFTFVVNSYPSEACLDDPKAHQYADSHRFTIEVLDSGG